MSDSKDLYSEASSKFVEEVLDVGEIDAAVEAATRQYESSKAREAKYNSRWKAQSVNINEVVELFAPDSIGSRKNVKYIFEGAAYNVVCDMAAGYLRVFKKASRKYVKLDGQNGSNAETHFKIKRREELGQ